MDFYNQLLAQKLSGGGGGDSNAAFKALVDGSIIEVTADMLQGDTSIRKCAFYYLESLTSITIPDSVTSIGVSAFSNCTSLTSITIPNSVTSIGQNAFNNCTSLTSVTIPDSITSISDSTFYNCKGLTSITIPDSVTSINGSAFAFCSNLTSATVEPETPPALVGGDIFYGVGKSLVIYVPAASVDAYKSAAIWSNHASKIQAIPSG